MGKKICFVTGTRADYGIMAPVMREVENSPEATLQIVANNMHMSPRFGMTVDEIEADGFKVDAKIASLVDGATSEATVLSMARLQEGLAKAFGELKPDLVVILGDRYEALAAASAAVAFNIPIAHLHGGETTEGAIDDKFRHAITQLSDLHFASTRQYADRIVAMGKDPDTVFHSGAPGSVPPVPSAEEEEKEAEEFYSKTGIYPGEPFLLLAFHPVTLLPDKGKGELDATLEALDSFINQGYKVLVTLPNSDPGNDVIRRRLEEWTQLHEGKKRGAFAAYGSQVKSVTSLGSKLFHHALDNALAIVGNSSAALIEAPSHRLGAVNVGDRQKGRAHGITVIDAPDEKSAIEKAIDTALSMEMKAVLMGMHVSALNPYYKEGAAAFIAEKLIKNLQNQSI